MLALHGSLTQSGMWIALAEGAGTIRMLCPDQRGFGGTASRGYWAGTQGLVDDARVMTRLLQQRH